MNLLHIMKIGYAILIVSILIMIWISMVESKEIESAHDSPCFFNPLCTCSKSVPDLGIVRCEDVHLPSIPETVNISKVFMLHLENNQMRTIEPYFLQSTGLYQIIISKNPLSMVSDEAFIGLERSLWELEISHCDLTVVPNRAIRYLRKLRRLDLTGNDINKISPENWRGIEHSLEVLILAENFISHLPIDAFSGLPNLETIDLRGNNLREIEPSVFRDGMGKLAHLILADNQLGSIPYQALQPMRFLKTLDLSYNRINKMEPSTDPGVNINLNYQLNLDLFKLDYNQINILKPMSFQYFNVVNKTYLDGNPIISLEENSFRQAKIRELYLRSCGLTTVNPMAFSGLENSLEILDLTGNNISLLPETVFHLLQLLRTLSLRDNDIQKLNPIETFNGFQFTLYNLDLSGTENAVVSLQDLRRLRSLRTLSLSKLKHTTLFADNFIEYGIDLEELEINFANLQTIKNNAFQHVHGLKFLDLSENSINTIETNAFIDIAHSLKHLKLSHGLSSSLTVIPVDSIKVLSNLKELDLSNNKLKTMPETSFHFLKQLEKLELQDNNIEIIHKGTFQGDIHEDLEEIYLSFNSIKLIGQHTFVHLANLRQLHLDDNRIESLDRRAFMNLKHIQRLNLKGNKIASISFEAFQNLPELEDLDMSYNKIDSFDFTIFDQVGTLSIFSVNISHNNLRNLVVNIPSSFEGAVCSFCQGIGSVHSNIKILDLSHNNISSISKQFFRPVELSLTHLYLSHNNMLNASRDVFGSLRHLQWLDISHNGMYEMDFDMFRNTKKLQVLIASHNKIADVANDLFRFLNNLRIVDLSHNRLRALPDNLFREEGLERLDLSHNMIGKLPLTSMSVATAMTVRELDLSWNSISSLSHGGILNRFKKLSFLDLSYNRLAQIDAGTFKGLSRLSYIDLSHNTQLALEPNGLSFQGLEYTLLHLRLDNVSLSSTGVFCKMYSLQTLKMDNLPNVKNLNIPTLLQYNTGLRNLEIHVDSPTDDNLEKQMSGDWPLKLKNITFTGKGLKKLGLNVLNGVRSPVLHFGVHNTSIKNLPSTMFDNIKRVTNLTIDVSNNQDLQHLLNPSKGNIPNLYQKPFLTDLDITGNKWTCDCDLGWVEVWLRKRRQYLCGDSPSLTSSFSDPKYTCRHADDDLRTALCNNKNNQSVIDVLKTEIECGWSDATHLSGVSVFGYTLLIIISMFNFF
ncbi:chaoptin isoform X3 [Diorhabda carinulata]|uniref:chaoptin isoform X3 n=1 Tax=Diorhabda carinulata TaxID=1163345 RepID=UPI0025A188E8|nr:chaoptin isoform X3 [Diorhabda carinulata]